jgi:putative transport protein
MQTTADGVRGVLGGVAAGLGQQPFVLLFATLTLGYALGRVRIKGFGLGVTASTLLVGLGVSLTAARLFDVEYAIPEFAGTIFFNLFMFSVGMKVGPQFVSGLRRDAAKFVWIALLVPALSLAAMLALRALFDLQPGMSAGIFAGSNTSVSGLGAAQTAYAAGAGRVPAGVPNEDVIANMSTAFACAYCISMTLFVLAMRLPDMFGRDTARAAHELEAQLRSEDAPVPPGAAGAFVPDRPAPWGVRTYVVEQAGAVGARLDALRAAHPSVSVERVVRDGRRLEPSDELVVHAGDLVTLYGATPRLIDAGARLGSEAAHALPRELLPQTVDIVTRRDAPHGCGLSELARGLAHGLYVNALFRGGQSIPFGPETELRRGDVVRVTGTARRLSSLEGEVGRIVRPSVTTDVLTVALGVVLGALVGMITISVGPVRIPLGAAVGLLVVGIALSMLRTYNPALGGPYPEPARQMIEDVGLNVFVAILGINSGAGVIEAVESGALVSILVGCAVVGVVPATLVWFIGRYALRMNLAMLLGAVAGARSNSAAMRAAQDASRSTVPAIAYPVTYAISSVVLTVLAYAVAMLG